MSHDSHNYASLIRKQGFRLTPQRQLILDTVCEVGGHATAKEIHERIQVIAPAVNRATVYRTLDFFRDLRLIVASDIGGKTVYEIADPIPHHHLVCRRCGRVEALADHHFHELFDHLMSEHNFEAELDHVTIPGICDDCRR
jgi:Fe2+ or Zn2+ uptake regulation protein